MLLISGANHHFQTLVLSCLSVKAFEIASFLPCARLTTDDGPGLSKHGLCSLGSFFRVSCWSFPQQGYGSYLVDLSGFRAPPDGWDA